MNPDNRQGGEALSVARPDARHAFMTDPVAFRLRRLGNRPQRLSLSAQRNHFADRRLLSLVRDSSAVVAAPEPKGHLPAKIPPTGLLIGLDLLKGLIQRIRAPAPPLDACGAARRRSSNTR